MTVRANRRELVNTSFPNIAFEKEVSSFIGQVLNNEVYTITDPEGVQHHEFVSGNHGRKLDFDRLPTYSPMYIKWLSLMARGLMYAYQEEDVQPELIVGVANGANRLARHMSSIMEPGTKRILGLETEKDDDNGSVYLPLKSIVAIDRLENPPELVVVVEDVGSTGSTSVQVASELYQLGLKRVEVYNGWQRSPTLPRLDELGIFYSALIKHELPIYDEGICQQRGYCSQDIPLIPYAKQESTLARL